MTTTNIITIKADHEVYPTLKCNNYACGYFEHCSNIISPSTVFCRFCGNPMHYFLMTLVTKVY